MSGQTLKEIFSTPNITENLILEEGLLPEQISSLINQIIKNQLEKFVQKGRLKLSKNTIGIIKKLNKLGVKKLYGYDLSKVIPALEQAISKNAGKDMALLLRTLMEPNQTTRKGPGRSANNKFLKREDMKSRYKLKALFVEESKIENLVETETKMRYTGKIDEFDYSTDEEQNTLPQNDIPESPIADAADTTPPLPDEEVILALSQDNSHYGEHDNALEE